MKATLQVYTLDRMGTLPANIKLLQAAMLFGAVGLAFGTGGAASPFIGFAGGAAANVFGNLLTDGCKATVDYFVRARHDPTALAHNFDVSALAGKAIADIVEKAYKEFPKDRGGHKFLESASRITASEFAKCIEGPQFDKLSGEKLMECLGAPHGGITDKAATQSIWHLMLVEALRTKSEDPNYLPPEAELAQGLVFAAQRLWERFPAQFNGVLRNDESNGGRAWIAVQSIMLRNLTDLTTKHSASHQQHVAEFRALSLWLTGSVDALDAQSVGKLLAADGALVSQLRENRILAYTNLARVDKALEAIYQLRDNVDSLRALIASGPKLKSLKEAGRDNADMVFTARRVPLLARDAELADLRAFLSCNQDVAWWLWHGPAGIGKSRLAFELCRELDRSWDNQKSAWLAGFLDVFRIEHADWSTWKPQRPTLIVVDYASGKVEHIAHWIAQLTRAAEEHRASSPGTPRFPVRFLMLDRDANPQWVDRLRSSASEPQFVDSARYMTATGTPIAHRLLPALPDDQLPQIVQVVYTERQRRGDKPKNTETLLKPEIVADRYRKADLALRPLFVTLAAHAAFDGNNVTTMNEEALVRNWWKDELPKWAKHVGEQHASTPAMLALRRLFVLATMAQGLPMSQGYSAFLARIADADLRESLPKAQDYANQRDAWIKLLSPDRDDSELAIPPIEPDYFGELFVLDHIRDYAKTERQRRSLLKVAAAATPVGLANWVVLATRDFPDDTVLHQLLFDLCQDTDLIPFAGLNPIVQSIVLGACSDAFGQNHQPLLAEALLERVDRMLSLVTNAGEADAKERGLLAASRYNLALMLKGFADRKGEGDPKQRSAGTLYARAEELYEAAMQADAHDAASRYNLALMLQGFADRKGEGDPKQRSTGTLYARVEELYEAAMQADANHAISRSNLAVMLEGSADRQGEGDPKQRSAGTLYARAEELYEAAMQADANHAASRSNLALMLVALVAKGERSSEALVRAESLMMRAVEIDGANLPALLILSTLLLARGDQKVGTQMLQHAFSVAQGLPQGRFGLHAVVLLYTHQLDSRWSEMLSAIKQAVTEHGMRLPLLCLHRNAAQGAASGHPEATWLDKLAAVVENRTNPRTLDGWEAWQKA